MLGWSPRHPLQNRLSPGRPCSPQSHDVARFHSFTNEKPVLQPPHRIVIGFDLGVSNDKSLHNQASESPRSVLEPDTPQSSSPRLPLSALGGIRTGPALCNPNTDPGTGKAASNVLAAHDVTEIERSACGADRICSDLLALFKYNGSQASDDQRNRKRTERYERISCSSVLSSDDEDDNTNGVVISKPIFSAGSPIPHYPSHRDRGMEFLSKCYRCRRKLVDGKDIFMYRGGQAFCSQDCRCQQIVADERKHRSAVVTPCISRVSCGVGSVARARQPALA